MWALISGGSTVAGPPNALISCAYSQEDRYPPGFIGLLHSYISRAASPPQGFTSANRAAFLLRLETAPMDWDQITDKFGTFGESVGKALRGIFGARNERMVKELAPLVEKINELETWAQELSKEEMQAETASFKAALDSGEVEIDALIPKAFAMVREASVRTLGMRHFDVQLVGGIILHQGSIAEMMTGEGKTLMATLSLYLNACAGPAFLVTVNDYLARRDANWMGPIFEYLGLTFGSIQSQM
ncbi:MAG: hypothetical protein ACI8TQ_003208, partial [Planctomycetota bacterium]